LFFFNRPVTTISNGQYKCFFLDTDTKYFGT